MRHAPAGDCPDASPFADRVQIAATRDIASLEAVWRGFETTAVGHVFQTYDFMSTWCARVAPGDEIEPVIVTGTASDGKVLFLLPLGVRRKLGSRTVEWLGGAQADYLGGLYDADYLKYLSDDTSTFERFVDAFVDAIGGADLLHFTKMPADYGGTPNPFLRAETYPNANGAHATHLAPDWDTYYKAKRKSGWRRTDRSKERQLSELGEVSFVIADRHETVDEILDTLFQQKREWLAGIGVDDMFAPEGVADFYRSYAHDSLDRGGNVQLSALYCGDRIAAASYGLVFRGTYYYILHSYDPTPELADKSSGRQLMYRLMQWCFDNGITVMDFTIGDESYKDSWCELQLDLVDAAIPLTRGGSVSSRAVRLWQHTKRQIKKDETLWSAAVGLRKALKALKRG
mgnify:CR=1 FL=1